VPHGEAHLNFGWKVCEGMHVRGGGQPCETEGFTPPALEYGRDLGSAIVGGYVYRGSLVPALRGTYVYGDYGGAVFSLEYAGGQPTNERTLTDELALDKAKITSFGQDIRGEVYVVLRTGEIMRIEAAP